MDLLTALGAALAAAHFGAPFAYYAAARRWLKMPWRIKPDPASLPAVTVAIPIYNEARHIEEKPEDVYRQDYPRDRLEIIVVDSASTDGTAERAKRWAAAHPDADVKVLQGPERRGKANYATAGGERLSPPIPLLLGRTHALRRIRGAMDGISRSRPLVADRRSQSARHSLPSSRQRATAEGCPTPCAETYNNNDRL